jgi:hypothetical protein
MITMNDRRGTPARPAEETAMAGKQIKVHPLANFHHEGAMVYAGGEPVMMDEARANAMKAAGNVRIDSDKESAAPKPAISMLQAEGRPNAEPTPTPYPGDPVTPAPGEGPVERPELAAEPPVDPGTVNPEPEPDTSLGPVSPPPGDGPTGPAEPHEDPAERAAAKVRENRAPNDLGAEHEDNYAFRVGPERPAPTAPEGATTGPAPAPARAAASNAATRPTSGKRAGKAGRGKR